MMMGREKGRGTEAVYFFGSFTRCAAVTLRARRPTRARCLNCTRILMGGDDLR